MTAQNIPILFALTLTLTLTALLLTPVAEGTTYGFDISQRLSLDGAHCMKDINMTFAIVRGYQSTGHVDPNAKASIDALHDAGVRYINTYMFPCPTCGISASTQVSQLKDAGLRVSQVWLDIEGPQYWHSSQTENRNFLTELYHAAKSEFGNVGIYSSESQWSPIFGRDWELDSHAPLWFADYNGEPSCDDFISFGGWRHPAMKQFSDAGSRCDGRGGVGYDINAWC